MSEITEPKEKLFMEISYIKKCDITEQRVKDLLCCALEGGSNYWYTIVDYHLPEGKVLKDYEFPHLDLPFEEHGSLEIQYDDGKVHKKLLNRTALMMGLITMRDKYFRHFEDFVNENEDAITGDVFLQCCVCGEAIFG